MASKTGIIVTAFLTALATSVASDWLPAFAVWGWNQFTEERILTVYVKREANQRPVTGVRVSIYGRVQDGFDLIDSGETNERGIIHLAVLRKGELYIEAVWSAGRNERMYKDFYDINQLPFRIELDPDGDDWTIGQT